MSDWQLQFQRYPETIDLAPLRGRKIIGIDGDQGSGKSTLALELREALGGNIIELDTYLLGDNRPYVSQLQIGRVKNLLSPNQQEPQIIEGVMLLEVLELLGITADALIFAKLVQEGSWQYKDFLRPRVNLPKARLTREIAEYYRSRKPWDVACIQTTLFVSSKRTRENGTDLFLG